LENNPRICCNYPSHHTSNGVHSVYIHLACGTVYTQRSEGITEPYCSSQMMQQAVFIGAYSYFSIHYFSKCQFHFCS